jgi:hypothetical protein
MHSAQAPKSHPLLLIPGLVLLAGACRSNAETPAPAEPASVAPAVEEQPNVPEVLAPTEAGAHDAEKDSSATPELLDTEDAQPAEETKYPWPHEMIEGEPMFKLMEHDDLPSIDAPIFVNAETADAFMDIDEQVLGVVGKDGTAKCYSAWQLDSHEIVNDMLDGEAITATW